MCGFAFSHPSVQSIWFFSPRIHEKPLEIHGGSLVFIKTWHEPVLQRRWGHSPFAPSWQCERTGPGLAVAAGVCRASTLLHSFHLAAETTAGDICNPGVNDSVAHWGMARSSGLEISRTGSAFRETVDVCLQSPSESLEEITPLKSHHQKDRVVYWQTSYQRLGLRQQES